MVTRARAPPHLSFQILSLLPAELPLFHGLGVTIIIEVEQDDREMRQLSHYSFDGGYHGGTVRWSPSPRYSWMVHLNISKVFIGFLGTIHGYVSLREVSAFISTDVADDI